MKRPALTPSALAALLTRQSQRFDVDDCTRALLFAAAASLTADLIRREAIPRRRIVELQGALRAAESGLEARAVH